MRRARRGEVLVSCEKLPAPAAPFRIVLPGGAELVGSDLGALAQPALAPLVPLFRVADVVDKVVDVLRAVPDAIAVPPNPGPLIDRLGTLARAAGVLSTVLPPVSVPATARSVLDALIEELRRMRGRLVLLDAQEARISRARTRALSLGDANLLDASVCATENLERAVAVALTPLEGLRGLLELAGLLIGIAGGAPLPPWRVGTATDRAALTRDLVALEQALARARAEVPA